MRKGGISVKQKVLNVFKPILFLAIGIFIFICIQYILTQKNVNRTIRILNGFYALEDNTVDVLVLGPSTTTNDLSLMELYEDKGFCAYQLGSAGTPIDTSYFLLKEAFHTQSPKVVLLEVNQIIDESSSNYKHFNYFRRIFMDMLPLDSVKWEMAQAYSELPESHGFLSAIFPIIEYHERWSLLSADDFKYYPVKPYDTAGNELISKIVPSSVKLDSLIAYENDMLKRNTSILTENINGIMTQNEITEPIYAPQILDYPLSYLVKIKELCQENNAQLVLIKMPTMILPKFNSASWNQTKSNLIRQLANNLELDYYDLLFDVNLSDFTTDSYDGGYHLNWLGAKKVTAYLGTVLKEKYSIQSKQNDVYDEMLKTYVKFREIAELETQTDFYSYIENLSQRLDKSTIFICANNEYTLGMTQEDYRFLSDKLGVQMAQTGAFTDSYVAVIDKGELLYEAVSNREIEHDMQINDLNVNLASSGWLAKPNSSVKINGKEYAQCGRGLNIVVYDNESGLVIDSVSFDTYQAAKPASRTSIDTYLRAYESAVCFD